MQDEDAIQGLKQLGLTTYEARVFLALQKLGSGTASEISETADVPRSQVYGAAEELEGDGLVETQQSTPTVYRPVPLAQARRQLLDRLANTGEQTFEYLDAVQNSQTEKEQTESIWLIHDSQAINSRSVSIVEDSTEQVLYGAADPSLIDDQLLTALERASESGVEVVVASANPTVLAALPDSLTQYEVPEDRDLDVNTGRLLLSDGTTILMSTLRTEADNRAGEEIAFWTSDNAFAAMLAELASAWLRAPI
jgi:sugar-specific transcriptional regulator TrmB